MRILALGAFFVAALLSGCGSGVPGNSVADVAGNPLTTAALNHWMYVAAKGQALQSPGQPVIVPTDPPDFKGCIAQVRRQIPSLKSISDGTLKTDCGRLFSSLSSQVMDSLIKAYWYQAEAFRQHISVTDAAVQKAFNAAKQQQFSSEAQFQSYLASTGLTLADILFRFRVDQLYTKLLAKYPTTVSDAQIAAYYQTNIAQYGSQETRDIRVVLTKTAAQANAAKAALQGGASWNAVAKQYSTDPTTKSKGGLLSGVTKGQEDQALDQAAFSAPANKLLGPIQGQFGFYVFEVTKIKPATLQPLSKVSPLIKQTLLSRLQAAAQQAIDNRARKDWLRQTQCRSAYLMADCSGYKAPRASSSSSTTTATTS